MKKLTRTAMAVTAAALATAGVVTAAQPGSASTAPAVTHTLKLAAHQTASHNVGKTAFLGADTDRNPTTHAIVGYDSITGHFNFATKTVKIDAAVALKGGIITVHLTGKGSGVTLDGTITGGTGKYAGATGTIHTQQKNGSKVTHITITYTL
jgi:hypothetical protein